MCTNVKGVFKIKSACCSSNTVMTTRENSEKENNKDNQDISIYEDISKSDIV
jgi:hypothetical protein